MCSCNSTNLSPSLYRNRAKIVLTLFVSNLTVLLGWRGKAKDKAGELPFRGAELHPNIQALTTPADNVQSHAGALAAGASGASGKTTPGHPAKLMGMVFLLSLFFFPGFLPGDLSIRFLYAVPDRPFHNKIQCGQTNEDSPSAQNFQCAEETAGSFSGRVLTVNRFFILIILLKKTVRLTTKRRTVQWIAQQTKRIALYGEEDAHFDFFFRFEPPRTQYSQIR